MALHETSSTTYPARPGYRREGTSREAAEAITANAGSLRADVLIALTLRPMTSWEAAQHLGLPFEAIQPRFSELLALGHIEDSGARGPARSAHRTAIRWRLVSGASEQALSQGANVEAGSAVP